MANEPEETMERWRELALSVLDQNKRLVEELQEWMKLTERLSQENKQLSAMLDEQDPRGKLQ
jgi:hypothetical protein